MTKRLFTRTTLLAAASAAMLFAGTAIAQTAQSQQQTQPLQQRDPVTIPNSPVQAPRMKLAPNPLTMEDVTRIKGAIVYGGDEKRLGSVAAVLMQPSSKTIDRLVVSEGGVLGIGSHLVVLPLEEFAWDTEKAGFRIQATAEELKAMPAWKEQLSQLPAPAAPVNSATSATPRGAAPMGAKPPADTQ